MNETICLFVLGACASRREDTASQPELYAHK